MSFFISPKSAHVRQIKCGDSKQRSSAGKITRREKKTSQIYQQTTGFFCYPDFYFKLTHQTKSNSISRLWYASFINNPEMDKTALYYLQSENPVWFFFHLFNEMCNAQLCLAHFAIQLHFKCYIYSCASRKTTYHFGQCISNCEKRP